MSKGRNVFRLLLATALMSGVLVVAAPNTSAAPTQFTFFDQVVSQTRDRYPVPTWSAPPDWTAPVDYANGRALMRLAVTEKPSNKTVRVQICLWRAKVTIETCSRSTKLNQRGVYWIDLGMPANWWKKNGNWSWAVPFEQLRLMVKDDATGQLLILKSCGTYCYKGGDIDQHVPITFDASTIVVAAGADLAPPAKWQGCPTSWGPACNGSAATGPPPGSPNNQPMVAAGPDLSTQSSGVSLRGSASDDGLPSGGLAVLWAKLSGPGTVTFANKNAASTTATFSAPGTYELRLRASDGELSHSDRVFVTVGSGATTTTTAPSSTTTTVASTTTTTTAPPGARTVSVGNAIQLEGDSGHKSLPFKISLSSTSSQPVTVEVTTVEGSAQAGSDFNHRTVTVSIPAGQKAAWVGVAMIGDTVREPDETLDLVITSVSGAAIGDGTGRGVIDNDD